MPNPPLKEINGHQIVAFDGPEGPWGILSNSAPYPIKMKTNLFGMQTFPSVEHYIQYLRNPDDQVWMKQIQIEPNANVVQEKGANFISALAAPAAAKFNADWLAALDIKLGEAIDAKLSSHNDFAQALEDTEDAFLVADTGQRDALLQDGNLGWKASHKISATTNFQTPGNRLGIILMEKRNAIHYKKGNDFIVGATTQLSKTIRKFLEKNYPNDSVTTLIQKNPDLAYVKRVHIKQAPIAPTPPVIPVATVTQPTPPPSKSLPPVTTLTKPATSTITPQQPKANATKPKSLKPLEDKSVHPKTRVPPVSRIANWKSRLASFNPVSHATRKKPATIKPAPTTAPPAIPAAKQPASTPPKLIIPASTPAEAKQSSSSATTRAAKPAMHARRLSTPTARSLVKKTNFSKPAAPRTAQITPPPMVPGPAKSHKNLFSSPPTESKTSSTLRPIVSTVAPRAGNSISGFNSRPNIKKILASLNEEQKDSNWEQKSIDLATKDVILADKDNHTFTVQNRQISTTDETLETFKAMLMGFQAVSPNTKPKITFTEARLEQAWKDACAATNIKAELVYKPSASAAPDDSLPSPSSRPSQR
jgi:predicted NAD-dependent protein-ADP-ribosyltransferase YbiA (DUF1768 family)